MSVNQEFQEWINDVVTCFIQINLHKKVDVFNAKQESEGRETIDYYDAADLFHLNHH